MSKMEIERLHQEACDNEEDTYIDPSTKRTVLTSHFLKQRGFCCNGDCRHCPYPKPKSATAINRNIYKTTSRQD